MAGNGTGIASWTDSKTTIADCVVSNNGVGIDLYYAKDVVVTNCVIAQNSKRGVQIYRGRSPLIIDSTVIGNQDDYNGGGGIGGGSAVIQGCLIANNSSRGGWGGGGLLLNGATSMVIRCVVSNNIALGSGGGACLGGSFVISNSVFCDNVSSNSSSLGGGGGIQYGITGMMVIEDTIVERNRTKGHGGGILSMNRYPATLRRVTLRDNTAEGLGGGLYTYNQDLVVTNCAIYGNRAMHGGGICITDLTAPRIVRCHIYSNTVSGALLGSHGGGIYAGSTDVKPWIENCLIHHNTADDGGGIVAWSAKMTVMNCTVTANAAVGTAIGDPSRPGAGGLSAPFGGITIINTIFYGDTLPEIGTNIFSGIVMAHSDVQGGWPGDLNLNADPLFRNATAGDYHLAASSPCIDAGTDLGAPGIDLDGNPRPLKGGAGATAGVDIGAYEFVDEAADTDGDGLPDGWELTGRLNPTVATGRDGAAGDPDRDGMSNADEYAAATDPSDPLSSLRVTSLDAGTDSVSVSWSGGQQAWQCLERAEALLGAGMKWSVLWSNAPPNAVATNFTDVSATTNKSYFYRIRSGRQ